MDYTFVRLPFQSFIGCSPVLPNFELVDCVCHVLYHPRNATVTIPQCRFEFGLKV